MVLKFDAQQVWTNVRQAPTEDLLDRITVYRAGMVSEALEIIEGELRERGVDSEQIERHAAKAAEVLYDGDGIAISCSHCRKPAVTNAWGWQKLWKMLPVFPRRFYYCAEHRPDIP